MSKDRLGIMKSSFKGIDAVKHKLNLRRVRLALEQKRLEACEAIGVKSTYNKCLVEVNESKIEILKLENKIIKHHVRHARKNS